MVILRLKSPYFGDFEKIMNQTQIYEKLKCQYGSAKSALSDPEENISITGTNGRKSKNISKKYLAEIIEPRMSEILSSVRSQIEKAGYLDRIGIYLDKVGIFV